MSRLKKRWSVHGGPEERQGCRDRARSPGKATLARSEKPVVISVGNRASGVFYRRGARVARGVAIEPPWPVHRRQNRHKKNYLKVNGTFHDACIFHRFSAERKVNGIFHDAYIFLHKVHCSAIYLCSTLICDEPKKCPSPVSQPLPP